MEAELNNDARQKARDLARQITVAHNLDMEIQEELCGHIEDKLLAYKSGEEPITDDDAFILVREHFGDTETLKTLFQDVHRVEVERNLFRTLLVAAITTFASVQCVAWLAHLAGLLIGSAGVINFPAGYASMAVTSVAFLLPFLCFVRWKQRMERGERVWFAQWKSSSLAFVALALFGTSLVLPGFWAPLRNLFEIPYALHLILLQSFPPHSRIDYAIYPMAFLVVNSVFFAIVVWGGMRIGSAKHKPEPASKASRWLRAAYLCAALAFVIIVDSVVLSLIASSGSSMVVKTYLLTCTLWSVLVLACCASWVWWCEASPRLTGNTVRVALVWGGVMALYNALPTMKAGFASGQDAWLVGVGTTWFNYNVLGSGLWVYLGQSPFDRLYAVSYLPTLAMFAIFFAVTVALIYRVFDGNIKAVTAGE